MGIKFCQLPFLSVIFFFSLLIRANDTCFLKLNQSYIDEIAHKLGIVKLLNT